MTDLAQTVDRRVDQLGVACSDDSESENESDPLQRSAATSAPSARPGKLKSGREAKATSEVLYSKRWPHSSLQCRRILGRRNLVRVRNIVVAAIFDFMTVEDWGRVEIVTLTVG